MASLLPVTVAGMVTWCIRSTVDCRISFVHHYLWRSHHSQVSNLAEASRWFALDYLGHDGVFILRLIEINYGSCVLTHVIGGLYSRYMQETSTHLDPIAAVSSNQLEPPPCRPFTSPVTYPQIPLVT